MKVVRGYALEFGVALGCALVMLVAIEMHPGIPAFRHDWQWPPVAALVRSLFLERLDAWAWLGLGLPNITVQVHPSPALAALLSFVLSPKAILALWLTVAAGSAALGTAIFARTYGNASAIAAGGAGVLYALSPVIVNKLIAGHLEYYYAYSVVPWFAIGISGPKRIHNYLAAFAFAWTALQIQVFLLCIPLGIFLYRKKDSPAHFFAVMTLPFLTTLPYFVALLRPAAGSITSARETSIPWELVNSAPWDRALQGIGYFTNYWPEAARGIALYAPLLFPLGIAAALGLYLRNAFVWRLLAVYALGFLVVGGLKGPAAPILAYGFTHIPAASAFRELYDAAFLVVFAGAIACGMALSRIRAKLVQRIVVACIGLLVAWPWLSGNVFAQTGSVYPDAMAAGRLELAAANPVPARVLFLPAANPEGPVGVSYGGTEPLVYDLENLKAFWIYLPRGIEASLLWNLYDKETFERTANAIGIREIFVRRDFEEKLPIAKQPSLEDLVNPDGVLKLVRGEIIPDTAQTLVIRAVHGANPDRAFVPISDVWYRSKTLAEGADGGAMTTGDAVKAFIDCPKASAVVEVLGAGKVGNIVVRAANWKPFDLSCNRPISVAVDAHESIALADPATLQTVDNFFSLHALPRVELTGFSGAGDTFLARAAYPCSDCTLVWDTGYDSGWKLGVLHASTRTQKWESPVKEGSVNAWRVHLSAGDLLTVRYTPATMFLMLELIATFAWIVLVGLLGSAVCTQL